MRIVWILNRTDQEFSNGEVACHSGDAKIITRRWKITGHYESWAIVINLTKTTISTYIPSKRLFLTSRS